MGADQDHAVGMLCRVRHRLQRVLYVSIVGVVGFAGEAIGGTLEPYQGRDATEAEDPPSDGAGRDARQR